MQMNEKAKPLALKTFTRVQNVGDVFSEFAAKQYFSGNVQCHDHLPLAFRNLVFVGSVFAFADENSIVCGSGLIRRGDIKRVPRAITLLRGPFTFSELRRQGVHAPKLFADPGVLLPCTLKPSNVKVDYRIGIVPHYVDLRHPWIKKAGQNGNLIINPMADPASFAREVQRCETILSSSLHGIIFAHSYGRSACWIELSGNVIGDGFKFYDYYASLAIAPEAVKRIRIGELSHPESVAKNATFCCQNRLVQNALVGILKAKEALKFCGLK